MSRLMIKNLPAHATPETLRAHFSRSDGPGGVLTDVKVARKTDGTARRFGFVGYKSDEEALKAREWFDKTFVGSARIRVDVVDVSSCFRLFYFLRVGSLQQLSGRQRCTNTEAEQATALRGCTCGG